MTDMSVEPRSWMVYDPLLKTPHPVHEYPAGTWGPPEFDRLLQKNRHTGFIYEARRWSITPDRLNASSIPFFDTAAPTRCRRQRL
jgi:hypothetical protein